MSTPIYVNIYRLIPAKEKSGQVSNDALEYINLGIYHAGIEAFGQEYSFGMDPSNSGDPNKDGIFVLRPRRAVGDFKEQVKLGDTQLSKAQFDAVLDSLRPKWRAVSYHILNHNCCYFSLELAKAIDPAFEKTFPHYVYKAAGVGNTIVPDAVVKNLTAALAPPSSVPSHLVNKINVEPAVATPKPGPARAAPASSGGVFGFAKGLADKVKTAVGKDDATVLTSKIPDAKAEDIEATFGCHVVHIYREQYADVFVTGNGLCFVGENKLALRVPWAKIASLSYGTHTSASTGQHAFALSASKPSKDACLLIFTTDNQMIPLFEFTGFGQTLSSALGKITGNQTDERLEKAFDAVDSTWRAKK